VTDEKTEFAPLVAIVDPQLGAPVAPDPPAPIVIG
jgi:hypothetical protein